MNEKPTPSNLSKPEQYSVVIFAKEVDRHKYWSGLSCMTWPSELIAEDDKISVHRAVPVKEADANVSLPSSALMWTSTSHFVWYDSDASLVNEEQQRALLDWVHMGGQLILSGPDCLGAISNSFLSPYVPIRQIESKTLTTEITAPFAKAWKVLSSPDDEVFRLPTVRQIPFLAGELAEGSYWIDGADGMVATKRFGNGRVTMTTFPLSDDAFVRWSGFSSFVNGAILQHPPRDWAARSTMDGGMVWAATNKGREGDPELSTTFRTLTRDGKLFTVSSPRRRETPYPDTSAPPPVRPSAGDTLQARTGTRSRSIGSWFDEAPVSQSAIESLTAAAGINVPKIGLIMKLLFGYLIILVPVNWIIFRLMGRVELAWLAVPFLAVIGAGLVAKSVQLDIGFSRSESRVACIEAFTGYPRAHQTSFVSLYTSLSESYQAIFEKGTGVVLPSVGGTTSATRARRDSQVIEYQYANESGDGIAAFPVRSNSTGLLHSEEWVDLGGAFRSAIVGADENGDNGEVELENGTTRTLRDVGVCGVSASGKWESVWLGDVSGKSRKKGKLETGDIKTRWFEQWDANPFTKRYDSVLSADGRTTLRDQENNALSVGQMLSSAIQSVEFRRGKYVALGWIEEELGNLTVLPKASQQSRKTMFVIHLTSPGDGKLGPDVRLPPKSMEEEPIGTPEKSD